jgi:hypothetical protein
MKKNITIIALKSSDVMVPPIIATPVIFNHHRRSL